MTRLTLWLLIAALALIAGCTGIRLGYRHADTILAWRADDYFDFDQDQKRDFSARLDRLLEWHRYEQLPDYAEFLDKAIAKAQPGLKYDDVMWFVDGMRTRYHLVVERGVTDAAEMLAAIRPEQIEALKKQWAKDNRRFVQEHALDGSLTQRKIERRKRMLKQIEEWTGSLSDEQEHQVAALIETIPHINHLRHQDRIRRQKEFLDLLKLRHDPRALRPRLQTWLLNWEHGRSAEYEKLANEVYAKRVQFYVALDKLLTPSQHNAALSRLREFSDDFIALSKKGPKPTASAPSEVMIALLAAQSPDAVIFE